MNLSRPALHPSRIAASFNLQHIKIEKLQKRDKQK